jgi:Fe-Mn family superoxide dismutase
MYNSVNLSYEYDSLEPEIDKKTMDIHFNKHYKLYIDKLNKLLKGHEEISDKPIEDLIKDIDSVSDEVKIPIKNNAGGILNHELFFSLLKKDVEIEGEVLNEIEKKFESFNNFKEKFINSAMSLFGSGWTWLVLKNNELEIINTSGHDNPLSMGFLPILVVDMWEHAYYLNYQNKKRDYLDNFFNVINWKRVNELFLKGKI